MSRTLLHLIWALPAGGAERVAATLARGAVARGWTPLVVCLDFVGELGEGLRADGIEVLCMDKRPGIDSALPLRLAALLRDRRIDLLHAHMFTAAVWGRLAARLAGTRAVVQHEHSTHTLDARWRTWIDRAAPRAPDRRVAVSADLADRLRRGGFPADTLRVIENGIPLEHFRTRPARAAARAALGLAPEERTLLAVGRLEPRKDLPLLFRALSGLPATLLVAGDGPLRTELEALAAREAPGRVRFLGELGDVRPALAAADLYVSSSRTEGTSIALLEAMAAGVPVVATAAGGTPGVLGGCGRLVPVGDAQALATALRTALADPAGMAEAARAAQSRAREIFGEERMNDRFAALYDEISEERPASAGRGGR